MIDNLDDANILKNESMFENFVKEKLVYERNFNAGKKVNALEYRKVYFEKYPQLSNYNTILFKYRFAKALYKKDFKEIILKYIKKADILKLFEEISKDDSAIYTLSTMAINFFYNTYLLL